VELGVNGIKWQHIEAYEGSSLLVDVILNFIMMSKAKREVKIGENSQK
jgi:hypothetical protein